MHLGDLSGASAAGKNNNFWNAVVTVTVHNADHDPLQGATVSGTWSDGATGPSSCTTDSSGQCTMEQQKIHEDTTQVTFSVDDVAHATFTYVAEDNDVGTGITVTNN
jgi:hypothetical protein